MLFLPSSPLHQACRVAFILAFIQLSKFADDIYGYASSAGPLLSYSAATALPSNVLESAAGDLAVHAGANLPVPTNNPLVTLLPASLSAPFASFYSQQVAIAQSDLGEYTTLLNELTSGDVEFVTATRNPSAFTRPSSSRAASATQKSSSSPSSSSATPTSSSNSTSTTLATSTQPASSVSATVMPSTSGNATNRTATAPAAGKTGNAAVREHTLNLATMGAGALAGVFAVAGML